MTIQGGMSKKQVREVVAVVKKRVSKKSKPTGVERISMNSIEIPTALLGLEMKTPMNVEDLLPT